LDSANRNQVFFTAGIGGAGGASSIGGFATGAAGAGAGAGAGAVFVAGAGADDAGICFEGRLGEDWVAGRVLDGAGGVFVGTGGL
jgi:hypothetical protein